MKTEVLNVNITGPDSNRLNITKIKGYETFVKKFLKNSEIFFVVKKKCVTLHAVWGHCTLTLNMNLNIVG